MMKTGKRDEPHETSPLSANPKGFRKLVHCLVIDGFCDEARKLLVLALPVFLFQLMGILLAFVSSAFCGHLGKIELDSVTLAVAILNISGLSVAFGMTGACDTLISQTYGGKNLKRVGSILQRGILISLLCCFPCWALFINTEQILLLCKQHPDIARLSQKYVMIFLPALPANFLLQLQAKYLQNQNIMWPQVFIGILANVINAVVNAILLYGLKMGVEGSAWANTISQWAMALSLFIYIIVKKLHVQTWGGWSRDCLQEWGPYMHLAIPSMLMTCFELWSLEIGGLLAGLISMVELGCQAAMMELVSVTVMLPVGLSAAASARVGNALGAGKTEEAKKSSKVVLCLGVLFGLTVGCSLAALKNVIGYVFTTDRDILSLVSQIMLVFAPFHLCDAINTSSGGVLRGFGRQKIGAITNCIGFNVIGLPLGISLMFPGKLGIVGFWTGLLCPMFLQTCIYVPYILCTDWNQACEEAMFRAGVESTKVQKCSNSDIGFGSIENAELKHADTENRGAAVLCNIASAEDDLSMSEDDLPLETSNVVGEILSMKQLVIRRGLALFLCVTILLIGIAIKLFTINRLLITCVWMSANSPELNLWLDLVDKIKRYEKIIGYKNNNIKKSEKRPVNLHPRGAQRLTQGHIRLQKLNQRIPSSLILQPPSHLRKPDEQRRLHHQSSTNFKPGPSIPLSIEPEQTLHRSSPPLPTIVSTHSLQPIITVSDEDNREVKIETLPESTCSSPPVIAAPLATSSMGQKTTGATIASIEPLLVPCIPVQKNISSEELPSSSVQMVPIYEFLGDPSRNIKVPGSVLMKAKQKTQAKYAARYLVRALFTKEALLSSATGTSVQGLMALDANKVAAIREFLASVFPECDLSENGKDWKTCITNVNAMIRCSHLEAKKSTVSVYPKAISHVPDDSICLDSDDATEEDNEVEVPDDVHTLRLNALNKLKDKRSSAAQKIGISAKQKASDPIEHFGEPWRNVQLPFSVIYIGKGKPRPELSARYLIRHLFPEEILVKSNVYGNVERGVLPLDSNRIAALRDFLQQNYPLFDLKENGQDWKACVAAINSTIRSLRHDQKKALQSRKRTSFGIMDQLY